jgi:gliding motility-associated-like protein
VACAEHKPRIFIPNSFSPNSPVAENRTWRPKQVYVESGSYKLEILDRWGNVVFSTSDENVGWDGTIDGVKASEGSYLYQLNFRSKQGEPIEMLGTLLLIY